MRKTLSKIEKIFKRLAQRKITVPHESGKIVFAYPAFGPGSYISVGGKILERGMNVPTGDQMASLIYSAYCDGSIVNKTEFKEIREIMKRGSLWAFNRNLWTPEGVYVVQDLEAMGLEKSLNKNDLERMLEGGRDVNGIRFSKDGKVRFAPKGTYYAPHMFHYPKSLVNDGFVIASCGIEGVKKLAEISSKWKNTSHISGIRVDDKSLQGLSVFSVSPWPLNYGGTFSFEGYSSGNGDEGNEFQGILGSRAFGVLK